MFMMLYRMQDQGNLNYKNAIGEVGTVYVTIPAAEGGAGQVEVMFQSRVKTVSAYTKAASALSPGKKVKVIDLIGQSTLLVEPLGAETPESSPSPATP
jgi:hypothetical protein